MPDLYMYMQVMETNINFLIDLVSLKHGIGFGASSCMYMITLVVK